MTESTHGKLPPISAQPDTEVDITPLQGEAGQPNRPGTKKIRHTALWLSVAFVLAAWLITAHWGYRQLQQLQQQLISAQESFTQISKDAAGHIQTISGQVSATQSDIKSENDALREELSNLHEQYSQSKKQQLRFADSLAALRQQQQQLSQYLEQQANAVKDSFIAVDAEQQRLRQQVKENLNLLQQLHENQSELESFKQIQQQHIAAITLELKALAKLIEQLEQQIMAQNTSQKNLQFLQQEMKQLLAKQAQFEQEFSAFRAQMTRSINTLNELAKPQ